ncbi:kinesin light chain, partial [Colletotrichum incanum]
LAWIATGLLNSIILLPSRWKEPAFRRRFRASSSRQLVTMQTVTKTRSGSTLLQHFLTITYTRRVLRPVTHSCYIPGYNDPKANILMLVKTWLEKTVRGRWLIGGSIDTHSTAETQGGLARYIPKCVRRSILITTRNKQTASRLVRGNSLLEIGGMSESEASKLLRLILNNKVSTKEASNLSTRLEHLPLALSQAAAFMQENGISISKYTRLLDESDKSLVDQLSKPFKAISRDSETPHALTATWIVSFNQIQTRKSP